jgi:nucleoside triphosphate pyrophosphatase
MLLASASPRRRELLRLLNAPFDVLSTDIDETPYPGEAAATLVERLSRAKAAEALSQRPTALVIACDTAVDLDGELYGKPRDLAEARRMLRGLKGRDHLVFGGVTLCDGRAMETFVVRTRVQMRDYRDEEIKAYIATGDPLDKAAAYAVQHPAFRPVAAVEGCYANVMGLALCRLHHALLPFYSLPDPCLECHRHPEANCTVPRLISEGTLAGA